MGESPESPPFENREGWATCVLGTADIVREAIYRQLPTSDCGVE